MRPTWGGGVVVWCVTRMRASSQTRNHPLQETVEEEASCRPKADITAGPIDFDPAISSC